MMEKQRTHVNVIASRQRISKSISDNEFGIDFGGCRTFNGESNSNVADIAACVFYR
jgi:hypothetical protein